MIEVIDDFLPDLIFKRLSEIVTSDSFPWNCAATNSKDETKTFAYMVNPEMDNHITEISSIAAMYVAQQINHPTNLQSLLRVRYGLIHRDISQTIHGVHTDQIFPHVTALLYLNNCDGDTYFYEGDKKTIIKQVSPKANRLAIFDGLIYHSSSTPVNNQLRYAVNFNFGV